MNIDFFDPYPHEQLEPKLRSLVANATRLDAAIAFVTPGGTRVMREFLKMAKPGSARLVASIRYPTNLDELMQLSDLMPGNVFIHTGFKTPEEDKADRGQFHSKVVLIEYASNDRCIIVGSHNWTENALAGHNLEAATIIRCNESDSIVGQVRAHIEACVQQCEPFDPQRMQFYKAVQHDLHSGPPALSEDFPGFEPLEALVIHAEDGTDDALPDPMRLFIPVREPVDGEFFPTQQRVLLFLYPPGELIGKEAPTATPRMFDGTITMNNTATDAPVEERVANCQLEDLRKPTVEPLPGNVPTPSGEQTQVIIRLVNRGEEPVPLFHSAQQSPKMKLGVRYEQIEPAMTDDEHSVTQHADHRGEARKHSGEAENQPPVFRVPRHLIVRAIMRVPSQFLYPDSLKQNLNYAIFGSDFFRESDVPEIEFAKPHEDKILNSYIYLVNYRFTREALARIQKQQKLFDS